MRATAPLDKRPARHGVIASVLAAFLAVLLLAGPLQAQDTRPLKGVALVIGQSRYEHLAPLANPGGMRAASRRCSRSSALTRASPPMNRPAG
jgi:hypothetical protein